MAELSHTNPVPPRRAVSLRSVLLGLAGVVFICGLTPYNDYVVANTYLVGNFMPIGLLLFFLAFIMLVNAPLWRWRPRLAFGTGELATAMGMMLVSCALPSSGLMRYLPAHLANLHHHANERWAEYGDAVDRLDLPEWAFPTFHGATVREKANDEVVKYFRNRIPAGEEARRWPILRAWLTPAVTWGALTACILGAVLCGSVIVRHQWAENERLAFPLAGVYLSLIEAPAPGRGLNALFRNRGFWIAAAGVFVIHAFNAMHKYDATHWPAIPVKFDLGNVLRNPPWNFADWGLKGQTVYFVIVGFAFFIQSSVGFSLWFFYAVLLQAALMIYGQSGAEFNEPRQRDVFFGAMLSFTAMILWIGRAHWAAVVRSMFGRTRSGDPVGRYLPYSLAGWGLFACAAGTLAWLVAAGMSVGGALVLMGLLAMIYLVLARIVAETGLIFVQLILPMSRPWVLLLQDLPAPLAVRPSGSTVFWNGLVGTTFAHDVRESLPPFSTQALRVADTACYDDQRSGGARGYAFFACLVIALVVGFLVAGASTLWVEYSYGATLDRGASSPLNAYPVNYTLQGHVLAPLIDFAEPNNGPRESHSRLGHVGVGLLICAALSMLRLRFVGWPFHPLGLLVCFGYPTKVIWFSIFLGWLAKVMIVRFGGSELFKQARPVFLGLIIGEASAAAFWLLASLSLNALGYPYHAINLLPG